MRLTSLDEMIGGATLVALSEAVHGGAEPLELRNRLFSHLVQKKGFTAIAIESGLVESRIVHDYVRGGAGKLASVLHQGMGWNFDLYLPNRALIAWLRERNKTHRRARKINFYGFDMAGSPGNSQVCRGMDCALREALDFLSRVDREAAASLRAGIAAHLKQVHFAFRSEGARGYERFSRADRDTVTATVADLVALLERCETQYTESSTSGEYEWGYQAALSARHADAWLRHVPLGWYPSDGPLEFPSEETRFYGAAADTRDRAQADNVSWIVRREGPQGKVLIYASRLHVSMAPFTASWSSSRARQYAAGTYLKRRFGSQLITIGNLVGRGGSFASGHETHELEPASSSSIDGIASELGLPSFLLDLRHAPERVRRWLKEQCPMGAASHGLDLAVGDAFDILLYFERVTPVSH